MTPVSPSSSTASTGRQTTSRKAPSPYRSIPAKNRYTKSPNKVSRNNTFLSTNHRNQENGDGHRFVIDKVKCSSAGAVEELKPDLREDRNNLVEFFKRDDIQFSGSEEDHQQATSEIALTPAVLQPLKSVIEQVPKTPRANPVKTKSRIGRSQQSIVNGSNSKTIKFLLKLTTKSYFETLKYEIDRIKESDRKVQDLTSSQAHSIMTLNCKAVDFDNQVEDLRMQNSRLLIESRQKHRVQQDMVDSITCELNELKSVCNLLLKNIEKDHELEILARKLRKSKRFDSDTYQMLKSRLRKTIHQKSESKKAIAALVPKSPSIESLRAKALSETALKRPKSKVSRRSSARQTSLSSMSYVVTGSDMLTDVKSTSETSRKTSKTVNLDQTVSTKTQVKTKQRSGLMKICCCGGRSKSSSSKKNVDTPKTNEA